MLRPAGQAALELGRWIQRICAFAVTLTMLAVVGGAVLAWRLSEGPLDLSFLNHRVEKALNKSVRGVHISIGDLSIAWRGFSHGLDQPVVFRVTNVAVSDPSGSAHAMIPETEVTLSMRGLLSGWVMPRDVTLVGARIALVRQPDGSFGFDLGDIDTPGPAGPLIGLLAALAEPSRSDRQAAGGRFSQLATVSIQNAGLSLAIGPGAAAGQPGQVWSAQRADMDVRRHPGGGMDGAGSVVLHLGGQPATLAVNFSLDAGGRTAHVVTHLSEVTPKDLAAAATALSPALAPVEPLIAGLNAPLTLAGEADVGQGLVPEHARLDVRLGSGRFETPTGAIPFRSASLVLTGTPDHVVLSGAAVELLPAPDRPVTHVTASGDLTVREAGRSDATLHLTLDRLSFADLGALWPPGIAHLPRAWLVTNLTAGTAHDGKADFALTMPGGGMKPVLTAAKVDADAEDVAVTWMPHVPQIDQGRGHLSMVEPDTLTIEVAGARQTVKGGEPIRLRGGRLDIAGMVHKDQVMTVETDVSGPFVSGLALLREPALKLLDQHPLDLGQPSGDARLHVHAIVPLEVFLDLPMVTLRATGDLTKLHLGGVINGQDLDDGAVQVEADTAHLAVKGTARLAGIPAKIDGLMDFRPGPATQVVKKFTVAGKASAANLAAAGLDPDGTLTGETDLNVVLSEFRSGDGELAVKADLTGASLSVPPLGWRKPAGDVAKAGARVVLTRDKPSLVDRLTLDGQGIQVRGEVGFAAGKPVSVRLDRALLGQTDVSGTIRMPPGGPIAVDLTGPSLDVSAKLTEKPGKTIPGPAWTARARLDRVLLAHDRTAQRVSVQAENDGTVFRALSVTGTQDDGKAFSLTIGVDGAGRRMAANVAEAGALLNGLDVTDALQGGTLTVSGTFDDTAPAHPLTGSLEITDFRVMHAAVLGKLLQAVTLYGLVDALSGSGLAFSHLIAPFEAADGTIRLRDVRAFSPSLGLTAKGTIDRDAGRVDLEGTVVPAYVFNSLLGRLPLIGGLFSAEKGGGLLAMNYSIRGPSSDPAVLANPFSALTPGILRGMFGFLPKLPLDQAPEGGKSPAP